MGLCALHHRAGYGYNLSGNQLQPTVWLGKFTGDPASFRRFGGRCSPGNTMLGEDIRRRNSSLLKFIKR
jgi:hypothetical protein